MTERKSKTKTEPAPKPVTVEDVRAMRDKLREAIRFYVVDAYGRDLVRYECDQIIREETIRVDGPGWLREKQPTRSEV